MDGIADLETGEVYAAPSMGIPPAVAAAIIAVKKHVKQLGADDRNEHGKYNFVSVDKFYAVIGKLMAEAGLALLIDETATDVRGNEKTGSPWLFASYACRFIHESGAVSPPLRRAIALPISGPQAFGAAQSYVEKQLLRQVFKVPTGERDDVETNQSEDAPTGRSGGHTAQGSAGAATTGSARSHTPQAAPASPERDAAQARYKEMRNEIDASMTAIDARSVDGCPAWVTMEKMIRDLEPAPTADNAIQMLRDRIENRVAMLQDQPDSGGGY